MGKVTLFQTMMALYLSKRDLDEVAAWFMTLETYEQQGILQVLDIELSRYNQLHQRLTIHGEDRKQKDKEKEEHGRQ